MMMVKGSAFGDGSVWSDTLWHLTDVSDGFLKYKVLESILATT